MPSRVPLNRVAANMKAIPKSTLAVMSRPIAPTTLTGPLRPPKYRTSHQARRIAAAAVTAHPRTPIPSKVPRKCHCSEPKICFS